MMLLTFWRTFNDMPLWVILFFGTVLTGGYCILRLFLQVVTVWICRLKGVSIVDGSPVPAPVSEENKE